MSLITAPNHPVTLADAPNLPQVPSRSPASEVLTTAAKSKPKVLSTQEIHIATVNVRNNKDYVPPMDAKAIYVERPWSERKTRLVNSLLSTGPLHILGCQEVLVSFWTWHICWATLTPMLVLAETTGRKQENTVQSSLTTQRSVGWDAELPRIATIVTLRPLDKENGDQGLVHAINTHYDHKGVEARGQSSLLVRSEIYKWVTNIEAQVGVIEPGPIILFGDFNSPPHEPGYQNITSFHPLEDGQASYTFLDLSKHLLTQPSCSLASSPLQTAPYGPVHTFTGFAPPGSELLRTIDFVMLGTDLSSDNVKKAKEGVRLTAGRGGWEAAKYACLDNFVEGDHEGWTGRWSDHRAVRVTISRSQSTE
ncbi:hypothetical protein IAR55_002475 [Kwoniella newhampshirensis]|uniref:Endonuclease/exonuclease/phosphatase domain-containing protein n=1 Tax=Kwoniella newhampshirensis TaxID=1651941 RepID=A0AAW0YRJ4_9TREE